MTDMDYLTHFNKHEMEYRAYLDRLLREEFGGKFRTDGPLMADGDPLGLTIDARLQAVDDLGRYTGATVGVDAYAWGHEDSVLLQDSIDEALDNIVATLAVAFNRYVIVEGE